MESSVYTNGKYLVKVTVTSTGAFISRLAGNIVERHNKSNPL
ncbi:hypothetical protein [Gottfriedia acidiceleris]|nr:hypothetical protein [Gottfriedia acidiceleris]